MARFSIILTVLVGIVIVSSISVQKSKRLIKTGEEDPGTWLTETEIFKLIQQKINFIDITHNKVSEELLAQGHRENFPKHLKFKKVVREAFTNINISRIETFVVDFSTNFHNRYYNSQNGVESQQHLLALVKEIVEDYIGFGIVAEIDHRTFLQKSIIVRLRGLNPFLNGEIVILGAHQDSINSNGAGGRAPGADDNASGCIVLLEALRSIVSNQILLHRTVEFHWYAGEEGGLLGSRDIARKYKESDADVKGMINFDVVGYRVEEIDEVAIITDYVDDGLTDFLRILVDEYLDFGRRERPCGYACSDHAAWTEQGYAASRSAEPIRNPLMHTEQDTIAIVSYIQIAEFVKAAIGFLVELAEPIGGNK